MAPLGDSQLSPTAVGNSRRHPRALQPGFRQIALPEVMVTTVFSVGVSRILDKHVNPWLLRLALRVKARLKV